MVIWQQKATKAQQTALLELYRRTGLANRPATFLRFRRSAFWSFQVLMVPWCGMTVGIEPDGYVHS